MIQLSSPRYNFGADKITIKIKLILNQCHQKLSGSTNKSIQAG